MPKIIIKSRYITSHRHFINYLEYAGEKLEAQEVVFNNGSRQELDPESLSAFSKEELWENAASVLITFKDGHQAAMTPEAYLKKIRAREEEEPAYESVEIGPDGAVQKKTALDPAIYLNYIANRPSVEKNPGGFHGLFSFDGPADIDEAKESAARYEKNIKWSEIISLKREDAQRTGYDHRAAWENLIRAKAVEICKLYNIRYENLVLNAAYHDKDDHPHLHLFFYSKDSREGFLKGGTATMKERTERLRSLFFNEIFREDVAYLKEQKNDQENVLEKKLKELTRQITNRSYLPPPELLEGMQELAADLSRISGRLFYAYLPPEIKQKVNILLRTAVEKDAVLQKAFQEYRDTYRTLLEQYADDPEKIQKRLEAVMERLFQPEKKDSTALQNIIVKSALQYSRLMNKKPPEPKQVKKQQPVRAHPVQKKGEPVHKLNAEKESDFSKIDNPKNESLAAFREQLYISLRAVHGSDDQDFSFPWQIKLADMACQLERFEYQTFDGLSSQSQKDAAELIRQLLDRDDALKDAYGKMLKDHREHFAQFPSPDDLLKGFEEYLLQTGKKQCSSLLKCIPSYALDPDAKYAEWRRQNPNNAVVSKSLSAVMRGIFLSEDAFSKELQTSLLQLHEDLTKGSSALASVRAQDKEILRQVFAQSEDFQAAYDQLFSVQRDWLSTHVYDGEQNGEIYLEELKRRFYDPGVHDYAALHNSIERFAVNIGSHQYNARLDQCSSYTQVKSSLYKELSRIFSEKEPDVAFREDIQERLTAFYQSVQDFEKTKETESPDPERDSTKTWCGDLPDTLQKDIQEIFADLVRHSPKLKRSIDQVREEFQSIAVKRPFVGEKSISGILSDFENRFFRPNPLDRKSHLNLLLGYQEKLLTPESYPLLEYAQKTIPQILLNACLAKSPIAGDAEQLIGQLLSIQTALSKDPGEKEQQPLKEQLEDTQSRLLSLALCQSQELCQAYEHLTAWNGIEKINSALYSSIGSFAANRDSERYNMRLEQCPSSTQLKSCLYRKLTRIFSEKEPDIQFSAYIRQRLTAFYDSAAPFTENSSTEQGSSEVESPGLWYTDLPENLQTELRSIFSELIQYAPELQQQVSEIRKEYQAVASANPFYQEQDSLALLGDFEKRFFHPEAADQKSYLNLLLGYREKLLTPESYPVLEFVKKTIPQTLRNCCLTGTQPAKELQLLIHSLREAQATLLQCTNPAERKPLQEQLTDGQRQLLSYALSQSQEFRKAYEYLTVSNGAARVDAAVSYSFRRFCEQEDFHCYHAVVSVCPTAGILRTKIRSSLNRILADERFQRQHRTEYAGLRQKLELLSSHPEQREYAAEALRSLLQLEPELYQSYEQLKQEFLERAQAWTNAAEPQYLFEKYFWNPERFERLSPSQAIDSYALHLEENIAAHRKLLQSAHCQRLLRFAAKSMLCGLLQAIAQSTASNRLFDSPSRSNITHSSESRFSKKQYRPKHLGNTRPASEPHQF